MRTLTIRRQYPRGTSTPMDAEAFRLVRVVKRASLPRVARAAGVDPARANNFEAGRARLTVRELRSLWTALAAMEFRLRTLAVAAGRKTDPRGSSRTAANA